MNQTINLITKNQKILFIFIDIIFTLLSPIWVYILIINFNVFATIGIVLLYLFLIVLSAYMYKRKIILTEESIKYIGIRSLEISYSIIKSVSIGRNGLIIISTLEKEYHFAGYVQMLIGLCSEEKNTELVKQINKFLKLKKNFNLR